MQLHSVHNYQYNNEHKHIKTCSFTAYTINIINNININGMHAASHRT